VVTYEKQKDFTSAKEVMEQYIEEYPEDEEALREYIFLQTR
jgi:TolA-binding protein